MAGFYDPGQMETRTNAKASHSQPYAEAGALFMKAFVVRGARVSDGRRRMLMFKSDWYAVPLSIAYAGALAVCFLISVGVL